MYERGACFFSHKAVVYDTLYKTKITVVSFSSCQRNLIKTFQIEAMIAMITKMATILMSLVRWQKIAVKKSHFFLEILGTKVV